MLLISSVESVQYPSPLGLVDADPRDEGQAGGNLLLVLHVVLGKEVDEGELLLFDPLPEEAPAGYCVAQDAHGVAQHHLPTSEEGGWGGGERSHGVLNKKY